MSHKITYEQALEAYENSKRSKRAKTMDKKYKKSDKYILDENDPRGSEFLTVKGQRKYDFKDVDDGSLFNRHQQKILNAVKDIIAEKHKEGKNAKFRIFKDKLGKYTEKIKEKVKEKKKKKEINDKDYLTYISSVNKRNEKNFEDYERQKIKYLKLIKEYNGEVIETDDDLIFKIKGINTHFGKFNKEKVLNYKDWKIKEEEEGIKRKHYEIERKQLEEDMKKKARKENEEMMEMIEKQNEYKKTLPRTYTDIKKYKNDMKEIGFEVKVKRGVEIIIVSNSKNGFHIQQRLQ
jgi:hypothetical protein